MRETNPHYLTITIPQFMTKTSRWFFVGSQRIPAPRQRFYLHLWMDMMSRNMKVSMTNIIYFIKWKTYQDHARTNSTTSWWMIYGRKLRSFVIQKNVWLADLNTNVCAHHGGVEKTQTLTNMSRACTNISLIMTHVPGMITFVHNGAGKFIFLFNRTCSTFWELSSKWITS